MNIQGLTSQDFQTVAELVTMANMEQLLFLARTFQEAVTEREKIAVEIQHCRNQCKKGYI